MKQPQVQSILVVEDDDSIREVVRGVLEYEGYSVLTARNGKEALDLLNNKNASFLILLDLMMPVMDGWEFLRKRKQIDRIAAMPVVVISAVQGKEKELGATQVLRKPPDLDTLLELINQYGVIAHHQKAA